MASFDISDTNPGFSTDQNEVGDVILKLSTADITINVNVGNGYDDAVLLESSLRDLADMVRDDILEDWEDVPGEHDGYVSVPGNRDGWHVQLSGKRIGDKYGFPSYGIAVYELARAVHASGEESNSWCEGEHGPTARSISAEVLAHLRDLDEQKPLPGVQYQPEDMVLSDGWGMRVDRDYGTELGVVLYASGDPSVREHVTDRSVLRRILGWATSASADAESHDQETDLDAIGSPGGASWASVAPDGRPGHKPWTWTVYRCWLDVDTTPDSELAAGEADTEDEAKEAVTDWVASHQG